MLNPRQELFAQEMAKGSSATAAAKAAGYAGHRQSAYRLMREPEIAQRIGELQQIGAEEIGSSQAERIKRYAELGKKAEAAGDLAAAIRAEDSITKVAGWFTADRANSRSPLEDMSPAQRDALRAAIDAALEAAEKDAATERANS